MSPKRSGKTALPRLIVLSAPSGAGKTTLCEMLLRDFPDIELSVSTTTRTKRPNEVEGVHYYFVSKGEFEARKNRGEFAEWATVHGNFYGSSRANIDQALGRKKHVLFDIDVQGAQSLVKLYGDRVLLVFIHPPSMEVLENRLKSRKGDSQASIETRLRNAYNEVGWSQKFDYQIVNEELGRAYSELRAIFEKECQ